MKKQIYYRCLGIVIHAVMVMAFIACGKPNNEKKEKEKELITDTRTEMDEELENLSNGAPKVEKRLHLKTKALSIRIIPKKVLLPIEEFDRIVRGDCGRGNWDENTISYDKSKVSWKNYTENFVTPIQNDLQVKITSPGGTNINSSLKDLIKAESAFISSKDKFIEIKFPSKNWSRIPSGKEELDIEISIIPAKTAINVGHMREIQRRCVRARAEPSRGVDGAVRGGLSGLDANEKDFSIMPTSQSFGYMTQVFEVQYDLEIRFLSQY